MSNSFSLGRSEFTQIAPGTPIPIQVGGSFGRIKSVAMDNMCLDIEPEQPYPVDRECKEIKVRHPINYKLYIRAKSTI